MKIKSLRLIRVTEDNCEEIYEKIKNILNSHYMCENYYVYNNNNSQLGRYFEKIPDEARRDEIINPKKLKRKYVDKQYTRKALRFDKELYPADADKLTKRQKRIIKRRQAIAKIAFNIIEIFRATFQKKKFNREARRDFRVWRFRYAEYLRYKSLFKRFLLTKTFYSHGLHRWYEQVKNGEKLSETDKKIYEERKTFFYISPNPDCVHIFEEGNYILFYPFNLGFKHISSDFQYTFFDMSNPTKGKAAKTIYVNKFFTWIFSKIDLEKENQLYEKACEESEKWYEEYYEKEREREIEEDYDEYERDNYYDDYGPGNYYPEDYDYYSESEEN